MTKGIFITGTGTDIGKTYATALIIKKLREAGYNTGYYKAALSGAEEKDGKLIPGDAEYVCKTAGIDKDPAECVSYIYKNAYSPHLAALLEGNPVEMDVVIDDFKKAAMEYSYLTVEGSGGIVCPIRYDKKIMLEDIVKTLGLPSIIIADAGLGTLNSIVLTVEYMRARGLKVNGIILNNCHTGSLLEENNAKMAEELTGVKILAKIEHGANDIDTDASVLAEAYEDVEVLKK